MLDWLWRIILSIFIAIDRVVYSCIELVYELFILISETGVFGQATIQSFANRIYVFLGLVMIFVVSIALVQYILDPKKFNDSKVGGTKLLKDFIFVLIGIIMIPYIFEWAYGLQRIVLKDNLIGNLILGIKYSGAENGEEDAENYATYGGKMMAYATMSAFITFNPEVASYTCINEPVTSDGKYNRSACGQIGDVPFSGGLDENGDEIKDVALYTEFVARNKDFRALANKEYISLIYESTAGDKALVDYKFIISTIAGGFIIWILLGFCIDIAVRSVKLGFLQLIAPVPLMMKLIPGSGQKKFDSWVKECTKTYGDIFTRLAAIYFAIFIIASITTEGLQNVAGTENNIKTVIVQVAIIFGALMFAKDLPELIKNIMGGSGKFELGSPFKKIMSSPYSGLVAGGAMALGRSGMNNLWATGRKLQADKGKGMTASESLMGHKGGFFADADGDKDGNKFFNAAGNVGRMWANSGGFLVGGAVSGGVRGAKAGYGGGKGGGMKSVDDAVNMNNKQREFKKIMAANDYGVADRVVDNLDIKAGVQNQYASSGKWSEKYNELQNQIEDTGTQENNMFHQLANLKTNFINNGGDYDVYSSMSETKIVDGKESYKYNDYDSFVNGYYNDDSILNDYKGQINDIKNGNAMSSSSDAEKNAAIQKIEKSVVERTNSINNQFARTETRTAFDNTRRIDQERKDLNAKKQSLIKKQKGISKIQSGGPGGK